MARARERARNGREKPPRRDRATDRHSPALPWEPVDYYPNAVRAEPGRCFRMVSQPPGGRQAGSPTDCVEPVRWIGRRQVGNKRMRLWSCEGRAEGLEDLRPINRAG